MMKLDKFLCISAILVCLPSSFVDASEGIKLDCAILNSLPAKSSHCFYTCHANFTSVIIPTSSLKDYNKQTSNWGLVTWDGCEVKEVVEHNNGVVTQFIQLDIPHGKCGTKHVWKYAGPFYDGFSFLSYIGNNQEIFTVESSCEAQDGQNSLNWDEIEKKYFDTCESASNEFIIPPIEGLAVSVDFFPLRKAKTVLGRKYVYGESQSKIIIISDGIETLHLNDEKGMEVSFGKVERMGVVTAIETLPNNDRKIVSFSLLPNCALGSEYVIMSYPSPDSYIIIMPTEKRTDIKLIPPNGHRQNFKLTKKPEIYPIGYFFPTGTLIQSNEQIAVFTVMRNAKVPHMAQQPYRNVDHMAEQLIPLKHWGRTYVSGPNSFYILRILAGKEEALIKIKFCDYIVLGGTYTTLKSYYVIPKYSFMDIDVLDGSCIVRSKVQISVAQIGKSGRRLDQFTGKYFPYMVMLTPSDKYSASMSVPKLNENKFSKRSSSNISIFTHSGQEQDIVVNGVKISNGIWHHVGDYAYGEIQSPPPPDSMVYANNLARFGSIVFSYDDSGSAAYAGATQYPPQRQIRLFDAPFPLDDLVENTTASNMTTSNPTTQTLDTESANNFTTVPSQTTEMAITEILDTTDYSSSQVVTTTISSMVTTAEQASVTMEESSNSAVGSMEPQPTVSVQAITTTVESVTEDSTPMTTAKGETTSDVRPTSDISTLAMDATAITETNSIQSSTVNTASSNTDDSTEKISATSAMATDTSIKPTESSTEATSTLLDSTATVDSSTLSLSTVTEQSTDVQTTETSDTTLVSHAVTTLKDITSTETTNLVSSQTTDVETTAISDTTIDSSQASSTVSSQETTVSTTPMIIVNCTHNPCGENGICEEHDLGYYCNCKSGFDGSDCSIKSSPSSGPCIMGGVDFSTLFQPEFIRSSDVGFVVQLIELNKRLVIRSLEGCPSEPWCGQFLTIENNKVYFTNIENGYQKWIFIPSPNSYYLTTIAGQYLGMDSNGSFILTNDISNSIQVEFTDLVDSGEVLNEPVLEHTVVVFPDSSPESANISFITNSDYNYMCFWSYAQYESDTSFPAIILDTSDGSFTLAESKVKNESNIDVTDEFGEKNASSSYNALESMKWHHICMHYDMKTLFIYINGYNVMKEDFAVNVTELSLQRCYDSVCFAGELKHFKLMDYSYKNSTLSSEIFTVFASEDFYDYDDMEFDGFGFIERNETIVKVASQYCDPGVNINNQCYYTKLNSSSENDTTHLSNIDESTHLQLSNMLDAISPTQESYKIGANQIGNTTKWSNGEDVSVSASSALQLWTIGEPSSDGEICYSPSSDLNETIGLFRPHDYRWTVEKCTNATNYVLTNPISPVSADTLPIIFFFHPSRKLEEDEFEIYKSTMKLIVAQLPSKSILSFPRDILMNCRAIGYTVADVDMAFDSGDSFALNRVLNCVPPGSVVVLPLVQMEDINVELTMFLAQHKVFLIGMGNVTLEVMNQMPGSRNPEHNLYLSPTSRRKRETTKPSFTNNFFGFLVDNKKPKTSDILKASQGVLACMKKPCLNNGTCSPSKQQYTCVCKDGYEGNICQYLKPEVKCGTLGVEALISKSNILEMAGIGQVNVSNVIIYWVSYSNDSDCNTQIPTTVNGNEIYKLFVPSPFHKCGLSVTTSASNVVVSGTLMYNLLNLPPFINMETVITNFTCDYGMNYNIGFNPDDMLSAQFRPVHNNVFSDKIEKQGKFVIELLLYRDEPATLPINENSTVVIGSNVYVLVKATTKIPEPLIVQADNCFLSPNPDAANKTVILNVVEHNCPSSNELPKRFISHEQQEVRFTFQVFEWREVTASLNLHCEVSICDPNEDKCNKNCSSSSRYKRDVDWISDNTEYEIRSASFAIAPANYSSPIPRNVLKFVEKEEQLAQEKGHYLIKDKRMAFAGIFLFTNIFYFVLILVLLLCCIQKREMFPHFHNYGRNTFYKKNTVIDNFLPINFTEEDVLLPPNSNHDAVEEETSTTVKTVADIHESSSLSFERPRRPLSTFLGSDVMTKF